MLELAATAARKSGMVVYYDNQDKGYNQYDFDGGIRPWLPASDSGDALRLAVRLHIQIRPYSTCVATYFLDRDSVKRSIEEDYRDDCDAATRLAIVRAASEMAKVDETVTETIRTHFLDPNLNTPHYPSCCVCGKKCGDTEYKVWSGNYLEAVHPDDVEKYNLERGSESGPCALIPVGPECVKKIPEEFRVRFRKS